jgi:Peptidase MA superfamily
MPKMLVQVLVFPLVTITITQGYTPSYQVMRHQNFLIKYEINSENMALKVVDLLDKNVGKMEGFYDITVNTPVSIIIAGSSEDFEAYSNSSFPTWTGATYLSSRDIILLKNPRWANQEIDFQREFSHELSHLYFNKRFGESEIPLWYNEGLAEYLSVGSINLHSGLVLSNAIWAKSILPFGRIDSLLSFSKQKAELAYVQSLSAVIFLFDRLADRENLNHFHQTIVEKGWANALQQDIGMDLVDFEIAWYRYVDHKYRWLFILNVENLIWVALLLILMIGMYLVRYRNKRILKKWEYEEQVHGLDNPDYSNFESGYKE